MQPPHQTTLILSEKGSNINSKIREPSPAAALSSHPQVQFSPQPQPLPVDRIMSSLNHTTSFQDFDPGYFFQTPGWKRFSVTMSFVLSVITLCTGAVAQLGGLGVEATRVLLVTGIIINAISVTLSALTSLNWQTPQVQEKQFIERMLGIVHVHADGKIGLNQAAHAVRHRFHGRKV